MKKIIPIYCSSCREWGCEDKEVEADILSIDQLRFVPPKVLVGRKPNGISKMNKDEFVLLNLNKINIAKKAFEGKEYFVRVGDYQAVLKEIKHYE